MIDFNVILFGEMLPYERYKLYNWVIDAKPMNILEVGTGGGGSTYCMAEAIKKLGIPSNIYTCDPTSSPTDDFFTNYPFVKYYKVKSEILIQNVITKNIDIDFIMFDGSEIPDIALEDILILENYIKDGTYFCMHDWEFTERGYDKATSTKSQKIRPHIENSEKWTKIEVLSGLKKNSKYDKFPFDSVGLCLYKFKNSGISLAITSFDRSDFVIRSFIQVLNNKLIDEIVIVDDHSDTNIFVKLWNLINDLDNKKIKLHRNPANLKPLLNKYNAVKKCRNEWVILLDSDNVINNRFVGVVNKLDKKNNIIYCPGMPRRLDGSAMWNFKIFKYLILNKKNVKKYIDDALFSTLLNTGNYFCNRKRYMDVIEDELLNYYKNTKLSVNDAMYFSYLWILGGNKMKIVPDLSYVHYQHGRGIGGSWFANNTDDCHVATSEIVKKIKKW